LNTDRPVSFGLPEIIAGLGEVAGSYDALICDVWGVLHDGHKARPAAVDALQEFRRRRGPVILLSNAPRPVADLQEQFVRLAVPEDCYDAILTSGVLVRDELARRAAGSELRILHIGPERDRGLFAGLPIVCVTAEDADIVLCSGLFDDDTETPDDYRAQLLELRRRNLTLLCANPDVVVQRGGRLVFCAGALAQLYEQLGGSSIFYGKPYPAIYTAALKLAHDHCRRADPRVLVLGDSLETDIRGANLAGLDAIFIADGIHGEEIPELSSPAVAALCARSAAFAKCAMRALVW
jgi:HAD superfamily hydrolase (TIGR01459 family)